MNHEDPVSQELIFFDFKLSAATLRGTAFDLGLQSELGPRVSGSRTVGSPQALRSHCQFKKGTMPMGFLISNLSK